MKHLKGIVRFIKDIHQVEKFENAKKTMRNPEQAIDFLSDLLAIEVLNDDEKRFKGKHRKRKNKI